MLVFTMIMNIIKQHVKIYLEENNNEFTEYADGNKTQDYTMNISSLNGSYVVGFGLFGNNAASQNYIRIFNLYLE